MTAATAVVVDFHDVLHRAAGGAYGGVGILEDLLDLGGEVARADQLVVGIVRHLPGDQHELSLGHFGDLRIADTARHGLGWKT